MSLRNAMCTATSGNKGEDMKRAGFPQHILKKTSMQNTIPVQPVFPWIGVHDSRPDFANKVPLNIFPWLVCFYFYFAVSEFHH